MSDHLFSGQCPTPEEIPELFALTKSTDPGIAKEAQGKVITYLLATHEQFISHHARKDFGNGLSTRDLAMTVVRELLPTIDRYSDYQSLQCVFRLRVAARAIDHLRRCVRMRRAMQESIDSSDEQDPKSYSAELERIDLIQQALKALEDHNPKWAEVVALWLIAADRSDPTFQAIGQEMGVSRPTAKKWFEEASAWVANRFLELKSL
jgi:RNA polymerase sigma factor (sigma-70 family)